MIFNPKVNTVFIHPGLTVKQKRDKGVRVGLIKWCVENCDLDHNNWRSQMNSALAILAARILFK
jgi:hypothetical protein